MKEELRKAILNANLARGVAEIETDKYDIKAFDLYEHALTVAITEIEEKKKMEYHRTITLTVDNDREKQLEDIIKRAKELYDDIEIECETEANEKFRRVINILSEAEEGGKK